MSAARISGPPAPYGALLVLIALALAATQLLSVAHKRWSFLPFLPLLPFLPFLPLLPFLPFLPLLPFLPFLPYLPFFGAPRLSGTK